MPKKGVNISLKGYDDIFSTEKAERRKSRNTFRRFHFLSYTHLRGILFEWLMMRKWRKLSKVFEILVS